MSYFNKYHIVNIPHPYPNKKKKQYFLFKKNRSKTRNFNQRWRTGSTVTLLDS